MEIFYQQVLQKIFAILRTIESLLIGRVVMEHRKFRELLPIHCEDYQLVVVPEIRVIEESDICIVAAFAIAGSSPSGPTAQYEFLFAEHAAMFIVMVRFDHSDFILGVAWRIDRT